MGHDVGVSGLKLSEGDLVDIPWREGKVTVTALVLQTLPRVRAALLVAAMTGHVLTYGQLAIATGRAYPPRGMGDLLDLISLDCIKRREPSLAALVVRSDTGAPGDAFIGDAAAEQRRCYAHPW